MSLRQRVVYVLVLGALACNDNGQPPLAPDADDVSLAKTAPPANAGARQADLLAPAIAAAMRSPAIRESVRDALRASLLTEHKLSFQAFVATSAGRSLLTEAARASNRTLKSIEALVAALPPTDFYVPAEQHRLTWKGTEELMVAAMLTATRPTIAHRPDGGTVRLDFNRSPTEYPALLLLQYAESKNRRVGPQANRPGLVIQDPGDGKIGGLVPVLADDGSIQMKQLADLVLEPNVKECPPEVSCGGGGGGGGPPPPPPPPPPSTYLVRLQTVDVQDGTPWEGNEFEFRATWRNGTATRSLSSWPRIEGVGSNAIVTQRVKIVDRVPEFGAFIDVPIYETDFGGNDFYIHTATDNIVKVFDFRKGFDFPCWRNGYENDFPARNTIYTRFNW